MAFINQIETWKDQCLCPAKVETVLIKKMIYIPKTRIGNSILQPAQTIISSFYFSSFQSFKNQERLFVQYTDSTCPRPPSPNLSLFLSLSLSLSLFSFLSPLSPLCLNPFTISLVLFCFSLSLSHTLSVVITFL